MGPFVFVLFYTLFLYSLVLARCQLCCTHMLTCIYTCCKIASGSVRERSLKISRNTSVYLKSSFEKAQVASTRIGIPSSYEPYTYTRVSLDSTCRSARTGTRKHLQRLGGAVSS